MIENVNALTGFIWFRLGGEWRDVNTMKNSRVTKKKLGKFLYVVVYEEKSAYQ